MRRFDDGTGEERAQPHVIGKPWVPTAKERALLRDMVGKDVDLSVEVVVTLNKYNHLQIMNYYRPYGER